MKTTFRSSAFRDSTSCKAAANRELHHVFLALIAILLIAYAQFVSAQTPVGTSQTQTTNTNTRFLPEALSLSMGLEYAEEVTQLEGAPKHSSTGLSLGAVVEINDRLTGSLESGFSRESTEGSQTLISDAIAGLSIKGLQLTENLKSIHSISGLIPVAETTIKTERLTTSITAQNGIAWQIHPKFSTTYRLGLTKNFHEFDINADGRPNIEYRLANSLSMKLNFTDAFYGTATGSYRVGKTYAGFERYSFQFAADLNYDLNTNWSMNLGTSNEGAALKPNGVDSNISLFDENSSVLRLGLSASI